MKRSDLIARGTRLLTERAKLLTTIGVAQIRIASINAALKRLGVSTPSEIETGGRKGVGDRMGGRLSARPSAFIFRLGASCRGIGCVRCRTLDGLIIPANRLAALTPPLHDDCTCALKPRRKRRSR